MTWVIVPAPAVPAHLCCSKAQGDRPPFATGGWLRTIMWGRNALKSAGSRSSAGKDMVLRNAVTHGLSAQKHLLTTFDDPEELERRIRFTCRFLLPIRVPFSCRFP